MRNSASVTGDSLVPVRLRQGTFVGIYPTKKKKGKRRSNGKSSKDNKVFKSSKV